MEAVRTDVKEKALSDLPVVKLKDCVGHIEIQGWVCEADILISRFAMVHLDSCNIWALFVKPEHEKQGTGWKLHDTMPEYFNQTEQSFAEQGN